ncbi:hypothetical protein [Tissierella sp.]|uniref:hypothetical protein n=1 Tax=Tissierella sp. TaxID=41274 RepID=UPI002858C852|nr:hypothetical protein [Tissierella sp.]MDR7856586.1 hypothetical protein [Tissierella sp.]
MSLNNYRDEAGDFLEKIGAKNSDIDGKVKMLEDEFNILKEFINEPNRMNHQVYDMLFLLFEIAYEANFDIDAEWNKGRIRKQKKYVEQILND